MEAESSRAVPPTDLGGESAAADTDYDETRDSVETQEAELVPVETPGREFDPQQQPAPAGPIKLIGPNESAASPGAEGGLR
jgi:hypothetical protein